MIDLALTDSALTDPALINLASGPAAVLNLLTGSATGLVAGALVAAVWQGALLAALVWLCLRMAPGLTAAVRSAVWLGVFVLLMGLQVLPVVVHEPASAARPGLHPVFHLDPRWSWALAALWLAASSVRAAQLLQGVLYLRRLTACAEEVPQSAELAAALKEAAAGRLSGSPVRLCSSNTIARPSVIGFFRPRVLIPARLLGELSQAELKQVLMHELEHLRRADDWTNLLQKMALVVFPLNPALAWVERRLCAERELACDDRVLAAGSGRKAYALCLAHLAEFALLERGFSLVLGAWERRPELVRRVHRILSSPARTMNRWAALGVSGGVLAAAVCGALALARSPQLVSFAPVPTVARIAEPGLAEPGPDAERSILHKRMAEPQLVSASLTTERRAVGRSTGMRSHRCDKMRSQGWGTGHGMPRQAEPEVKLAGLRMPPVPGGGSLLVMAEWNDLEVTQKMILADLRGERTPAATAVPAVYIVATPNGWLIVQI